MVVKYVKSANASKVAIDGPNIKQIAKEMGEKMDLKEFKASNGWLEKFIKRNDVKVKTMSGESPDVNQIDVQEWFSKISAEIEGYEKKDIYNFDETGLLIRLLPKKSYLMKGSDHFGGRQSKEKIKVGFCCSMTGEKLKPLIVGKYKKPKCF